MNLPRTSNKKTGTGPVTLDVEFECWLRVDSNHVHLHGDIKCALASPYAPHPGTRIPRSLRHNAMITNGDGEPARTRTWGHHMMQLASHNEVERPAFSPDLAEYSPIEIVSKIQCWIICDHVLELNCKRLALVEIHLRTFGSKTESRTHEVGCLIGQAKRTERLL